MPACHMQAGMPSRVIVLVVRAIGGARDIVGAPALFGVCRLRRLSTMSEKPSP